MALSLARYNIYDLRGRLIQNLLNEFTPAGISEISWDGTDRDGRDVASGLFFLRVLTEKETSVITRHTNHHAFFQSWVWDSRDGGHV